MEAEASSPAARCKSCGGPSADGDLCKSCKQAFAPVLGSTTAAEPSHESVVTVTQKAPVMIRTTSASPPPVVVVPPPVVAVPPPVVNVEPVESIQIEVARSETAKAVADLTAKAHLAKGANPPPVTKRPIVAPPPPQRPSRTRALMKAAALIVVAIGAAEGARRFGFQWPQRTASEEVPVEAPPPVVESGPKAERGATPPDARTEAPAVAENRAAVITPPKTAPSKAAASPKPTATAARRRAVRQETPSEQRAVPAVAAAAAPETPAPVPTRAPAVAAKTAAPPTGRFFERGDVDEPPQIATRVEPRLPANLPARPPNAVAVVRVLVSETGHPFRVSLLRGSMMGRSADEAVVAAVTQWTFSPARKRGQPVNCWYNIGVPLGQTN
jgi:TonB family protein